MGVPAGNATGGGGVAGVAGSTFFIQNEWHAGRDSRAGEWLSFSGSALKLDPESDSFDKVPWKVPVRAKLYLLPSLLSRWFGEHGSAQSLSPCPVPS